MSNNLRFFPLKKILNLVNDEEAVGRFVRHTRRVMGRQPVAGQINTNLRSKTYNIFVIKQFKTLSFLNDQFLNSSTSGTCPSGTGTWRPFY